MASLRRMGYSPWIRVLPTQGTDKVLRYANRAIRTDWSGKDQKFLKGFQS